MAGIPDFDDEETECTECNGRGYIYNYMKEDGDDLPLYIPCHDCKKEEE